MKAIHIALKSENYKTLLFEIHKIPDTTKTTLNIAEVYTLTS